MPNRLLTTIATLRRFSLKITAATLLAVLSLSAQAHWNLNNELSQLNFISIKASNIAETHTFSELNGSVDKDGTVTLTIDMASLDTLIPIRNERMGRMLFEIVEFPKATFTAAINNEEIEAIAPGNAAVVSLSGSLTLRDQSQAIATEVLVTRLNKRTVMVASIAPVLLNAGALGLSDGVEALREIAGLPSISHAVPVTFTLTFSG